LSALQLAEDKIILYRERPDAMVDELFGHALQGGLDDWQREALRDFPHNPRQALACCKGVGKTTTMAFMAWNYLLTRKFPKAAALSVTSQNLKDNLWAEIAKWRAESVMLQALFEMTSDRVTLKAAPDNWFLTARSFPKSATPEELGNTLAGLWAAHLLFLIDEAGGVPVPVLRTAEAALQREGTEGHLVIGGNTTQTDGALYEAVVVRRPLWKCYEVNGDPDDPKRCPRISIAYAREQIAAHGREDPFVMINLLAKFPSQGVDQLVSADLIRDCMGRHLHADVFDWAPRILGVDVADKGDDKSVIWPRQGLVYFKPIEMRKLDTVFVAGHVGQKATDWAADSIQVDASGGYGAGVIALLRHEGYNVTGVEGSGKPIDAQFYNKRAECFWKLAQNLKEGASIPKDPLVEPLVFELSSIRYGYKGDKLLIEPKEEIRARIGHSPDLSDGMAYTHAFPVAIGNRTREKLFPFDMGAQASKSKTDYDPLER
jgi:phage terminase large subunit